MHHTFYQKSWNEKELSIITKEHKLNISWYSQRVEAVVTELSFELAMNQMHEMLLEADHISWFVALCRFRSRHSG